MTHPIFTRPAKPRTTARAGECYADRFRGRLWRPYTLVEHSDALRVSPLRYPAGMTPRQRAKWADRYNWWAYWQQE